MIMYDQDLNEALFEILDDINCYTDNLRSLISENEEIRSEILTSNVRNLYSSVNYLAKILNPEES